MHPSQFLDQSKQLILSSLQLLKLVPSFDDFLNLGIAALSQFLDEVAVDES